MEHAIRQQDKALKSVQARFGAVPGPSIAPSNARTRSRSPRGRALAAAMRAPPQMLNVSLPVGGATMSVDDFTTQNSLDDKCYEALLAAPPEVQHMVLSQGPAVGKNPSAMVMARIAKYGAGFTPAAVGMNVAMSAPYEIRHSPEELEDFIGTYELDEKCAESLRNTSWACQAAVMGQGPVEGRNPSAMIMGRVAKFNRSQGL
eukprot:NODE_21242_length_762_cov_5.707087.p1 GENE.NODE_21242_length_762_cov_5.707087~~NODE_21242_length_762_cov_5.707087.p1  ORF type:complete len:219 (+),score=58.59 NODE_21242_length_762_cov_5.707087:50-658(+)